MSIPGPAGALRDSHIGLSNSHLNNGSDLRLQELGSAVSTDVAVLSSCGYFLQPSWRALCHSLDIEDGDLAVSSNSDFCPLRSVEEGSYDFCVPQVTSELANPDAHFESKFVF